ncbi:MAG: MBL fold metallo-hydrolase [Ignavibacteriaceae bacterium]|nr:MBL fold metallo-hydrolase [Ignavibacteriaceae bacterium]
MNIGKFKISFFESGFFALDGGAMFGIIPQNLWRRTNPPDQQNRIKLATRHLLLDSGSRKILVDTGMGDKWDEKSRGIYDLSSDESIKNGLEAAGYLISDITDVFLTHLHFDHTGGSTKIENGKLVPVFQNAKYHVGRKNFEWALNPSDRDKGSYIKENFFPLYEAGVLNFIDEDVTEFDDGIEIVNLNGHTFNQNAVKIYDSSNTLFYCGDLIPTSGHIPVPYVMGYDLQPLETVKEKKIILSQAVEQDWMLFFEHDPSIPLVKVQHSSKGYSIKHD